MSIPGAANPLLLRTAAAAGYTVSRSLRFNSSDSGYCLRTPSSNGTSYTTWTWSMWVKRSLASTSQALFSAGVNTADYLIVNFESGDTLRFVTGENGATNQNLVTTAAVFRDYSAWYHIVVQADFDNATAADRIKIYVNGTRQTISGTIATQGYTGTTFNRTGIAHNIGRQGNGASYFSGYLAEIHFIDGQALTPSSFTETSATTGQLIPKKYTGTFTGNSFWLQFADNSAATATTLGKDSSGLGNNWTPNNLSVTAGAGNDSLVDTPTSYGTDAGAGGEVRGNYCTLNPIFISSDVSRTFENGNLDLTLGATNAWRAAVATFAFPTSGKWLYEATIGTFSANGLFALGIGRLTESYAGNYPIGEVNSAQWVYMSDGKKMNASTYSPVNYGAGFTTGDVVGVAYDADNGTLTFYKNGASQGAAYTGLTGLFLPCFGGAQPSAKLSLNFGQRPFAYPVSGFKALCDTNLPAPVVAKGSSAFDVKLYSGTSATQAITGLGFGPDFVWIKERNAGSWHQLNDAVRGANKQLYSNDTAAEGTQTDRLQSFDSTGFTLGSSASGGVNNSGSSYVAWCWDAGSSTVTNTQGSITSSVRANASAGFSIVTYTCQSSGSGTIGHGLNVAPSLIISKGRGSSTGWGVFHVSNGWNGYLQLNSTAAFTTDANAMNNTAPTSTVWTQGTTYAGLGTYVAYCFAPVSGYSSFGSYVGNGSADGSFIYLGFRPRFFMHKRTDSAVGVADWRIWDSARDPYNASGALLFPNSSAAESTNSEHYVDFLSNGVKIRNGNTNVNPNGATFIYCAWAESPFQYARAR